MHLLKDLTAIIRGFFSLLILLACTDAWSTEPENKDLLIGISFSIPPYVIKESNTGLELEILKEAFKVTGYTIKPSYLPLARTFIHFQEGSIDGTINVKEGMVDGFYSDVAITFRNYAISLEERQIEVTSINDLSDKSLGAFQRAKQLLGNKFHSAVQNNSNYNEWADQTIQLKQLYKQRVEVIVLEQRIFNYFRQQLFDRSTALKGRYFISPSELQKPVVFHEIFAPSDYKFAFLSEQVRDDFNMGLRTIKSNGVYDDIFMRYAAGEVKNSVQPSEKP
jgi:polar amino acid transport system substrate-binding protein